VLTAITAASDGAVFSLGDNGVERLDTQEPIPNPPDLRALSIAATSATHLWVLMTNGDTQIWDGQAWREGCLADNASTSYRLAAGSDGTLWAASEFFSVSQCIREMWSSVPTGTAIGRLAVVSATAIYALGGEDRALYRWADDWEQLDGTTPMAELSASGDGLICGIDPEGVLNLFLGGQVGWVPTHFSGLSQIGAGAAACVWAIDANGDAVDLTSNGPLVTHLA
jgi:hypothetical protein